MTTIADPTDPPPLPEPLVFAYRAQSLDQQTYTGTLEAANLDEARGKLARLQLRVLSLEPQRRPRTRRLGGEDLIAFNQQLAQLAAAGLPLEHGLRLIAADMRRGGTARAVRQVAQELENGTPVGEAFAKHRSNFPPLYGRLVEAGVRTNNLPGMLLNIGAHLQLTHRLRAALWRAASYPLVILAALSLIVAFIGHSLLPQFKVIFDDFNTKLPAVTELLMTLAPWMPIIGLTVVGLILIMPILWALLRSAGWDRPIIDNLVLPIPLIGPVLRRNLIARWCDVLKLAVEAGLDLPQAIRLAGDSIGSRPVVRDGEVLIRAIEQGRVTTDHPLRLLPQTIPAALGLSSQQGQLAETLAMLSRMQQEQAELRLQALPVLLTPILMVLIALLIGFIVIALFAPLLSIIQAVSG
jgi:type IV pilus assembly protein PilC